MKDKYGRKLYIYKKGDSYPELVSTNSINKSYSMVSFVSNGKSKLVTSKCLTPVTEETIKENPEWFI